MLNFPPFLRNLRKKLLLKLFEYKDKNDFKYKNKNVEMGIMEWLPHGFFVDRGLGMTVFIQYDNIYQVGDPILYEEQWNVLINYSNPCHEELGFRFIFPTKEEADISYEKILENWKNFHRNHTKLEEKIIQFLSHIEVLPGGEEYEKAKDRFLNLEN